MSRGTQKEEGESTPTHMARSGQTLKGQGKRKAEADGHGKRPAEGGRTEAPEPTYHSETYACTGPNLPGEGRTHEIGDRMGD